MACKYCQDFFYEGPRPIDFRDLEAVFTVTESTEYTFACVGKAHCKYCKHPVAFDYEEVLLIKLSIQDLHKGG